MAEMLAVKSLCGWWWVVVGGGGYLVSIQLQLWLFCCWAVTIVPSILTYHFYLFVTAQQQPQPQPQQQNNHNCS